MSRISITRNPVQVRIVQFSSSLVGTCGCGPVRREGGRGTAGVRPALVFGLRPGTVNRSPENSAGYEYGFGSTCQVSTQRRHALVPGTRYLVVGFGSF
jgi:hypothetical protein